MEKNKRNNIYQMVTDRVIEQLKKGIIPWHRPWTGTAGTINYVTRKPYSLLNQMLLGREGEWITFKQLKQLGGSIKKGAKAGLVAFYGKYTYTKEETEEKEDGEEATVAKEYTIPVLRYYKVFHISDCKGIESKMESKPVTVASEPIERAEEIINSYVERQEGLKFKNDEPSNRAFYRPSDDLVVVPMLSQYSVTEEYYSTVFHEFTHSTMTESRCNRKKGNKMTAYGSADYSREELVAELGSTMLCTIAELNSEKAFKNSVAYIQGWLQALANDNKMIVWAASRAERAARYIIGKKGGNKSNFVKMMK